MARNQKLINYHTGKKTAMPELNEVDYGEIVVRHNEETPELLIKVSESSFGVFQASGAVKTAIDKAVSTAQSTLNTKISDLQSDVNSLSSATKTLIDEVSAATKATYATKAELEATSGSIITAYKTAVGDAKVEIYNSATTFATNAVTDATSTLSQDIQTVDGRVTELSGVVESISTNIGENYVTTGVLNTKVTELKTEISTAKDDAISSGKTYTDAQITAAKKYTDDQIKTSETTTNGLINGVAADLETLKTTVETDYVLKTTLNTKVSELEGKISKAQKDATDASSAYTDTQIAAAKEYSDGKLSAATETLKGSITTLSGNVHTRIEGLKTDLTNTINEKVAVAYRYKGTKTNYADLPTSEMSEDTIGFVYNVENANDNYPAGTNYAWNGTEWDALGGSVDLSPYALKTEVTGATKTLQDNIDAANRRIDTVSGDLNTFKTDVAATYETKDNVSTAITAAKDSVYLSATTAAAADAKTKADTAYSSAVTAAAASAETLNNSIEAVDNKVTGLSASTINIEITANSAIQNASIVDGATCKVSVNKVDTELQFDFSNLVVNCGEF